MRPTSRDIIRKVFFLHFEGDNNNTIATKLTIPPSTVSDILGLLPESIAPLRSLAEDLVKQKMTVYEAKEGLQFKIRLSDLSVGSNQLQDYIESNEKMRQNSDYEPKLIVEGAMKLNRLEEESGRSYLEALLDFEEKKDDVKNLEATEQLLKERIDVLRRDERRQLKNNKVTKRKINYIDRLRRNFCRYGIRLHDIRSLAKFLQNMEETNSNPRIFVQYTEEHGSLKERTAFLLEEEKARTQNLQALGAREELAEAAMNKSLSAKSELDRQNNEGSKKLETVRHDIDEAEQKYDDELAKLGQIMKVEPKAEKLNEALAIREAKLERLGVEIYRKEAKIKDLDRETLEKIERTAVTEAVTAFLVRQPSYDFNLFCSFVEQAKRTRKLNKYQTSFHLTEDEEQIRLLALGAFKGLLATTGDYERLKNDKEAGDKARTELETTVRLLKSKLEEAENKLETALEEKQFAEAVKAVFEGRATNIGEIRDIVLRVWSEEVERKAKEKYNATAAAAYGLFDYAVDAIARWNKNRAGGSQR